MGMSRKTEEALKWLADNYGGKFLRMRFPALGVVGWKSVLVEIQNRFGVSEWAIKTHGEQIGILERTPSVGYRVYKWDDPYVLGRLRPEKLLEEKKIESVGDYIDQQGETEALRYAIKRGKNVLLIGPTGTGKTTLIEALADEFEKGLTTINCDIGMEAADLIGYKTLSGGDISWVDGQVTRALRVGDWCVFDEVNFARPEIYGCLSAALDHRRQLTLKEKDGEVLNAHKDFRVFATMNTGYAGTQLLNQAFKDRFALVVSFDYLSPDKEKRLLTDRTGVDEEIASVLVRVAQDTRKNLDVPISTRTLLEWADAISKGGFSPGRAAEFIVLGRLADSADKEDTLNIIKNYVRME